MKKVVKVLAVALVCVLALAMLVACAPSSDPDKAVKALKENGFTATTTAGSGDVECTVVGTKVDLSAKTFDGITIIYYKDASAAKKDWDENKDDLEELKQSLIKEGVDKDDVVIERSGKMIYYGSKEAIKAAR